MNTKTIHFGQFILAITIMSSSGPLGRYIDLPVPVIIWLRCVMAALALWVVVRLSGASYKVKSKSDFYKIFLTAILLGVHWISYFLALKYSNVAIGMLSMFTYPVMTAVIEPIFFGSRLDLRSVMLALVGFSGIFLLVPEYSLDNQVTIGVLLGLFSALAYSLRNLISKQVLSSYSGLSVMMYQAGFIAVFLSPSAFWLPSGVFGDMDSNNWIALLLLGFYTTAIGHTLLVRSFSQFPVTMLSIISCLAPILGIIQGFFFLKENPTNHVMIGGAIILLSAVLESARMLKKSA